VEDRFHRACDRACHRGSHLLGDGAHILDLYRHEVHRLRHEVGVHHPADLDAGRKVHIVRRGVGDHAVEVGLVEYHHGSGPVLSRHHGVDYDCMGVAVDHRKYVYAADGLLEAVHVGEVHIVDGLRHLQTDRVVAHDGTSQSYHGGSSVPLHGYPYPSIRIIRNAGSLDGRSHVAEGGDGIRTSSRVVDDDPSFGHGEHTPPGPAQLLGRLERLQLTSSGEDALHRGVLVDVDEYPDVWLRKHGIEDPVRQIRRPVRKIGDGHDVPDEYHVVVSFAAFHRGD